MKRKFKLLLLIILSLLGGIVMDTEAQIENKFFGKWEYKGKNTEGVKTHFIYEFKADSTVIFKGYRNNVEGVLSGRITENLEKNKVKVAYNKSFVNKEEIPTKYDYLVEITIIALSSNTIKIITIDVPNEYNANPKKEEFILTKMK